MDIFDERERLQKLVEEGLVSGLPDIDAKSEVLRKAMEYTLLLPGKRIRSLLLLLVCKAVRGDENEALPYAFAIEFIHSYSLIHDDLPAMDDDDLRRGALSNHRVFGEGMAILAGDGLLSAAFELLHRDYIECLKSGNTAALGRRLRAGDAIAAGCGCRGMIAGQVCDIESERKNANGYGDKSALEFIIANKTGALIRAAAEAGAWIGGAEETAVRAFSKFGESLGAAFQIADDLLDVEGETAVIGKTAGKDAAAGKITYPALYGIRASRDRLLELTETAVNALSGAWEKDGSYVGMLMDMSRSLAERVC